ncbi:DgyrCDS7198 [Dimorphilus gyrociliatus]|uniref:DgyrCDS7198 n=1 Tax=Dimorphilus gyrociliatus TaxID=2664684 RepID=A0A7I8VQE0_9ANNE|nr:DgyrCDS7198 [Dimorphilus gyrociliatus]
MVGYDPKDSKPIRQSQKAAAGAISGVVCRAVLQPLDVLKIRMQVQVEEISKSAQTSKYRGLFHTSRTIFKEEGIFALWNGHNPAQILSVIYGIGQFGSFELYTKSLATIIPKSSEEWRSSTHFFCGALSGCTATICSYPFDLLRTRFIAQKSKSAYTNMLTATKTILEVEGWRSLYKGLSPTLLQIAPYSGLQFFSYTKFSQIAKKALSPNAKQLDSKFLPLVGLLSGLTAKTLTYPSDVVKKRLQVVGFGKARIGLGITKNHVNMRKCIIDIAKSEGYRGFYKGFTPSIFNRLSVVSPRLFSRYPIPQRSTLDDDIQQQMNEVEQKTGFLPNVFKAFSHRPKEYRAFFAYYDAVMNDPNSKLTNDEKELIIVATSSLNHCLYCIVAHGAVHRIYSKRPFVADQVAINYKSADITEREKIILDFAMAVASGKPLEHNQFEELEKIGFDKEDAWDIGSIASFFALSNRMAHLLDMKPNDEFFTMGRIPKNKST